jgi:hypothetical protein
MARDALIVPFFLKATNDEHIVRLKDFADLVRADEREACLANVKKVFATFDVLPESAEKKMLKSVTLIFIESIKEEIELRVKS